MARERTPSYQAELHPGFADENYAVAPDTDGFLDEVDTGFIPDSHDTGAIGLHDESFFDQDERNSDGAKIDEGTGLPYNNSGVTDEKHFQTTEQGHVVDPRKFTDSQDVMGPVVDEFAEEGTVDIADEWLRQHDVQPTIDITQVPNPHIPEDTQHVA